MSKDNLVISKDAAKTIGLNEAVLLEILNILYKTLKKSSFTSEDLQTETPFWSQDKLSKTLTSLSTATYPSLTELTYVKGVTSSIQTQLNGKQAALVSGTNIKTINGSSILGSGNLTIS